MLKPNVKLRNICDFAAASFVFLSGLLVSQLLHAQSLSDYMASPPDLETDGAPTVMLVMSRDNQLWHKAYNDYSDLDGVNGIDRHYNDSFEYYGNFNSNWCYTYHSTPINGTPLFGPAEEVVAGGGHRCSGSWSGNFLNWLTTTRMDIIRRVLYGGYRYRDEVSSTDPNASYAERYGTILQRAMLPNDNHAFVKIVRNSDLSAQGLSISDFVPITPEALNGIADQSLSFCNVTNSTSNVSSDVDVKSTELSIVNAAQRGAPLIKIAAGEHPTWAGSEQRQCMFQGAEEGHVDFSPEVPSSTEIGGLLPRLVARVAVCVRVPGEGGDLEDEDLCRVYQDGGTSAYKSYKPFGLLQQYGESGLLRFGLMTGSYTSSINGAVLRKKVAFLGGSDVSNTGSEIDTTTGIFNESSTAPGIISTLNAFRISSWNFGSNRYDDCNVLGLSVDDLVSGNSEQTCRDWGNPIGEVYLDALRYLHNPFGEPAVDTDLTDDSGDGPLDPIIQGLQVDDWPSGASEHPFYGEAACENCAVIVISSGLNDFDIDMGGFSDGDSAFNAQAVVDATNRIGQLEGISGNTTKYVVGMSDDSTAENGVCTGKYINNLSEASGFCPQAPTKLGGYKIAGAAYLAKTNDISDVDRRQTVDTYALSLSEPLPTFDISLSESANEVISFVPTCYSSRDYYAIPDTALSPTQRNSLGTTTAANMIDIPEWNPCSLVDLTVVEEKRVGGTGDAVYGRYLVSWEASLWGFDHDMDAYVSIEYCAITDDHGGDLCEDFAGGQENSNYATTRNNYEDYGAYGSGIDAVENYFRNFQRRPEWQRRIAPEGDSVHQSLINAELANGVQIRTSLLAGSATSAMRFGFILNGAGSDDDGVYDSLLMRYGGYNHHSSALKGSDDGVVIWDGAGCVRFKSIRGDVHDGEDWGSSGCSTNNDDPKRALLFEPGDASATAASTPVEYLKDPLWYAVKYGNFTDLSPEGSTGYNIPDADSEWGEVLDGELTPRGYFPLKNPGDIKNTLSDIFYQVSSKVVSGTSASINMQTSSGEGGVYQALYTPRVESRSLSSPDVTWAGSLFGLFVDNEGRIREDRDGDGVLDESGDRVLTYGSRDGSLTITATSLAEGGDTQSFAITDEAFHPIWSAQEELEAQVVSAEGRVGAAVDQATTSIDYNRSSYAADAANGRYIFTSINRDEQEVSGYPNSQYIVAPKSGLTLAIEQTNPGQGAPVVDTQEDSVFEFNRANFDLLRGDYRYFDQAEVDDQSDVNKLVDYIVGIEKLDYRSRSISRGLTNGTRYLLGDIIHSSPAVVGKPQGSFDNVYKDDTYADFKEAYKNRRNVVYIGANDGMLHAFNAGFFNPEVVSFSESPPSDAGFTATSHPLGSELWAYVPFNLLPHLKWLANPSYAHVYYVDGPVQSFDVKLWSESDPVHVGGWGTIIVAGMRFGGGDYSLDHDGDSDTPQQTLRSAYILMDVTDPERPPELIAEISHPSLGYTTSTPTVIKRVVQNSSGNDSVEWHLAFGSGPRGVDASSRRRALTEGISFAPAYLFTYDLVRKRLSALPVPENPGGTDLEEYSFTSGFASADWDEDYSDDVVYFGLNTRDPNAPENTNFGGKLKRGVVSFSSAGGQFNRINTLFDDASLPFSSKPYVFKDRVTGERWVYSGTGRYLGQEDNVTRQQQSFFGIKEPYSEINGWFRSDVSSNELFDTTLVESYDQGTVIENGGPVSLTNRCGTPSSEDVPTSAESFEELREYISEECSGWKFDFFVQPAGMPRTENSGLRNIMEPIASDSSLLISAFEPEVSQCSIDANGYLFAPHRSVGVAAPYAALGTDSLRTRAGLEDSEENQEMVIMGASTGLGIPSFTDIAVKGRNPDSPDQDCRDKIALGQNSTGEIVGRDINCEPYPAGRRGWAEIPVTW